MPADDAAERLSRAVQASGDFLIGDRGAGDERALRGRRVMAESSFQTVYYRAADGSEPVRDYVDALDDRRRAVLLNQIDRLNLLTDAIPHLPFPHSFQIEGELRELRCHVGAEPYRVLYRRSERLIVLLQIFRKKSQKVPEAEIRVARNRWDDFKHRMEAQLRRSPRAAGHDAP